MLGMELRHLRYFVAVAEEGSLTLAAERRLHTAQPSLSRQIRDLELEVGAQLLIRGPRGIELTPAGRAFLDHARVALSQVEVAGEAARRAAQIAKDSFVIGFLTGHEMTWLGETLRILRDDQPNIEVIVHSQLSPDLARGLLQGKLDVAFLRREDQMPGLAFRPLTKEPLVVFLPSDHRLATHDSILPQDIPRETFISVPKGTSPALRAVIDRYAARAGIDLTPDHEVDNISMAVSMIVSTGGIALLPHYARNLLPPTVVSRPLHGEVPTIDLVIGYNRANTSPLLKAFLCKLDGLITE
jgi:LysR family hca operon transcriptional activator